MYIAYTALYTEYTEFMDYIWISKSQVTHIFFDTKN